MADTKAKGPETLTPCGPEEGCVECSPPASAPLVETTPAPTQCIYPRCAFVPCDASSCELYEKSGPHCTQCPGCVHASPPVAASPGEPDEELTAEEKIIAALRARLVSVEAALEEARKDAERMDWFQDHPRAIVAGTRVATGEAMWRAWCGEEGSYPTLREAIDSARVSPLVERGE